jgi:hypothetical protein
MFFAGLALLVTSTADSSCLREEPREVVFILESCQPISVKSSPSRTGRSGGRPYHRQGLVVEGTLVSGRASVSGATERSFYFVSGKAEEVCPVKLHGRVGLTPIARCCDTMPYGPDCISAIPPATIRSLVDDI